MNIGISTDTMRHLLELLSLLMLLAVGHAALHAASGVAVRALRAFVLWSLYAGGVIAVLASPDVATALARLGLVALGAYAVRLIVSGIAESIRGPFLFMTPKAGELAIIVRRLGGLDRRRARSLSRRMVSRYGGDLSLLGLIECWEKESGSLANLEEAWPRECERALAKVREMALVAGKQGTADDGRLYPADASFLAQALCLYEPRSVERALSAAGSLPFGRRSTRLEVARTLRRGSRTRSAAEYLGLVVAAATRAGASARASEGPGLVALLWPALGLKRLGFPGRAGVLAVVEGLLLIYGIFGLSPLGRTGGVPVWGSSGLVFAVSAAVVHIEALFALGDFRRLAACLGIDNEPRGDAP